MNTKCKCSQSAASRLPLVNQIVAIILAGLALPLHAQTATSSADAKDEVIELSPFVVTTESDTGYLSKNTLAGSRFVQTVMEIPQSIQIANRELISDLGVDAMLPAVQMVSPGVNRRSFNPGDDQYMRGFRALTTLKDGFVMGSNAVGGLYDIDRIEVIKGPSALIYGQAANVGGVINYVSRRPTKTPQQEVGIKFGSFDYKRGEVHLSGPITRDLRLRYRADAGATDSSWSERRFGFYKDQFIGGGIEYDISNVTLLSIDGYLTQVDYYYPTTMYDPVTKRLLAQSDDFTVDEDFAFHNTYQNRLTATLTSSLSDSVSLRLFVGYNESGNDWLRPYALGLQEDDATLDRIVENYITDPRFVTAQADLIWQFDTGPMKHKFSTGSDYRRGYKEGYINESFALAPLDIRNPVYGAVPSTTPGTAWPGTGSGYTGYRRGSTKISSVYLQDQISLLREKLIFVIGTRFNYHENDSWDPKVVNPSGRPVSVTQRNDDQRTDRYGVVYRPMQNASIYFNHSENFLLNSGIDTLTQRPLVPSVGVVDEIGVKGDFFDGALSASFALFDMQLTNVRVLFTQGPGDPMPGAQGIRQSGTESNKGFEATLGTSLSLGTGVLNAVASFYHGDIRNAMEVRPVGPVNDTWSIFAKYSFEEGSLKGFAIGGGVRYQGDSLGPNMRGGVPALFPSYTVLNALVTYRFGENFDLQLNVDNLTDKLYVEGFEGASWIFTSKGREFKLSAKYSF